MCLEDEDMNWNIGGNVSFLENTVEWFSWFL